MNNELLKLYEKLNCSFLHLFIWSVKSRLVIFWLGYLLIVKNDLLEYKLFFKFDTNNVSQ